MTAAPSGNRREANPIETTTSSDSDLLEDAPAGQLIEHGSDGVVLQCILLTNVRRPISIPHASGVLWRLHVSRHIEGLVDRHSDSKRAIRRDSGVLSLTTNVNNVPGYEHNPCGNFSDTSSFKSRKAKGSIGHAFTVCIRTENQNQMSFYPFVLHEISVLVELILGHLRYLLTDVPPQPNSPPDNVFHLDRRAMKPPWS